MSGKQKLVWHIDTDGRHADSRKGGEQSAYYHVDQILKGNTSNRN